MIKNLIVATVFGVMGTASIAESAFDWAGAYGGVVTGLTKSNVDIDIDDGYLRATPGSTDPLAGFTLGYNFQPRGNFVFGVALDVSSGPSGGEPLEDVAAEFWTSNVTSISSLRAKGGVQVRPNTLAYVTAGVAVAEYEGQIFNDTGAASFREGYSGSFDGWSVGVGVETVVTQTTTFTAEIRHSEFDTADFDLPGTIPFEVDLDVTELRLGLNFHF